MKIICTLSLLFLGLCLHAQQSPGLSDIIVDTAFYIPVQRYRAIGVSYRTTRDRALSPLLFQGYGSSYSAYSWRIKKQWLWESVFTTQLHILENKPNSSVLTEIGYSYELAALREITHLQKGQWRFWLGPEIRMLLNTRIHSRNTNNVAAYDFATSLGVTGMLSKPFSLWGRSFAFSNQFKLPLAFLYARPAYAWGLPPAIYEEQKGSWKDAFQLGTLNNIMFISNQMNLDFYLRKRKKGKVQQYKAYRISYSWDFFQVNTRNSIQTGGHLLSFSRVITF